LKFLSELEIFVNRIFKWKLKHFKSALHFYSFLCFVFWQIFRFFFKIYINKCFANTSSFNFEFRGIPRHPAILKIYPVLCRSRRIPRYRSTDLKLWNSEIQNLIPFFGYLGFIFSFFKKKNLFQLEHWTLLSKYFFPKILFFD